MHEGSSSREVRRTIYTTLRFEKQIVEVRLQIAEGNPKIVKIWVHFCNLNFYNLQFSRMKPGHN